MTRNDIDRMAITLYLSVASKGEPAFADLPASVKAFYRKLARAALNA